MNTESSDITRVYDFDSGKSPLLRLKPRFCFGGLIILLSVVLCVYFLKTTADGSVKKLAGFCGLFGFVTLVIYFVILVFTLISSRTIVNVSPKTIQREKYFLSRRLIWRKTFRFSDFKAVMVDQKVGRAKKACCVGLNLISGRTLWVKHFANTPEKSASASAEELAGELSRDLQLPINTVT